MTIAEFINKVGFKVNTGDVQKVNDTISDIKSTATKLLGAIGIGFSLANMNALVEEFDAINDKINFAVSGLGDAKEAQKDILAAANAVKTSYSDMADVVKHLVQGFGIYSTLLERFIHPIHDAGDLGIVATG